MGRNKSSRGINLGKYICPIPFVNRRQLSPLSFLFFRSCSVLCSISSGKTAVEDTTGYGRSHSSALVRQDGIFVGSTALGYQFHKDDSG
jgi:hypothetical protein